MKTVYYNGSVYTGRLPLLQAFAVEDGKFTDIGSNADAHTWTSDEQIDLNGNFVCAGFNDSHMHLLNLGQALTVAPLAQHTRSLQDMIDCLSETAPGRGGWIIGRGWNQDYFSDVDRMPDRWDLDRVSEDMPVCAVRACGHALCVNSAALRVLKISGDAKQPDGGEIRMRNGEPTGIFLDNAMDLVLSKIPAPNKEEIKDMLRIAARELNRYGITSCQSDDYCVFHNLSWADINGAIAELEAAQELTVRVYEQANLTNTADLAAFIEAGNRTGSGTNMFRIGPLKLLGDGALGARTAYLSKPYADAPQTKGICIFTQEEFDTLIGYANQNNMQVAVHCIGDACLDMVLNSIEAALKECPRNNHRHGIVHCQITRPDQLERIAENNLHVYAQSIFLDYDIHIVESRTGADLAQTSYYWKWLMDHGVSVSNGSDCPVEKPDVLAGVQCAVTRKDLSGAGPYLPDQAFSVQEALDIFTSSGAHASFEEKIKGKILPGMLADFVVLGKNPFETRQDALKEIPVLATYLEGKKIY